MPAKPQDITLWSVEGRFQHLIHSPKGAVEGVMIDSDGAPAQFVVDAHDHAWVTPLSALQAGQALVLEGVLAPPSPKGEPAHEVYQLERLVSVDGEPLPHAHPADHVSGTVARMNYARHGAPNGVVLDTGDFVHMKPDGFEQLDLKIGDHVRAEGPTRPLAGGGGRVVEAHAVNGRRLWPAHYVAHDVAHDAAHDAAHD